MRNVLLIGMGNTIKGDDGAGIKVIKALKKKNSTNNNLHFLEFCDSNINLLQIFPDYEKIIFVDTISTGKYNEGEIITININELDNFTKNSYSTHQFGLHKIFQIALKLKIEIPKDISIFAIEIKKDESFCENISNKIYESVKKLTSIINKELN